MRILESHSHNAQWPPPLTFWKVGEFTFPPGMASLLEANVAVDISSKSANLAPWASEIIYGCQYLLTPAMGRCIPRDHSVSNNSFFPFASSMPSGSYKRKIIRQSSNCELRSFHWEQGLRPVFGTEASKLPPVDVNDCSIAAARRTREVECQRDIYAGGKVK